LEVYTYMNRLFLLYNNSSYFLFLGLILTFTGICLSDTTKAKEINDEATTIFFQYDQAWDDPALDDPNLPGEPDSNLPEPPDPIQEPNPVVPQPVPLVPEPGYPATESDPLVSEPEPLAPEPNPLVDEPNSLVREPKPLVNEPNPIVREPEPLAPEPGGIGNSSGRR